MSSVRSTSIATVEVVYSLKLYCADPACDALFEAEGSLDAVAAALCPFCGSTLGELTCMPLGVTEDEGQAVFQELELWVVHEPRTRRLPRRRKARLPKAA